MSACKNPDSLMRYAAIAMAGLTLTACGIKGPLEPAAPLFDTGRTEIRELPSIGDQQLPRNVIILEDEIFVDEGADPTFTGFQDTAPDDDDDDDTANGADGG